MAINLEDTASPHRSNPFSKRVDDVLPRIIGYVGKIEDGLRQHGVSPPLWPLQSLHPSGDGRSRRCHQDRSVGQECWDAMEPFVERAVYVNAMEDAGATPMGQTTNGWWHWRSDSTRPISLTGNQNIKLSGWIWTTLLALLT